MRQLLVLGTLALAFFSTSASSAVITTTFAGGNSQSGNMFDVINSNGNLTITGFDLNLSSGNWGIELYTKSGTWVGSQANSAAWTLVDSDSLVGGGTTFFDVSDFILGNGTSAFYLTTTAPSTGAMLYTNGTAVGNVAANDGTLQILEGAGVSYPFSSVFTPRIWNGSIYYEAAVPAPATLALIVIGLIGIGFSRRKKTA